MKNMTCLSVFLCLYEPLLLPPTSVRSPMSILAVFSPAGKDHAYHDNIVILTAATFEDHASRS